MGPAIWIRDQEWSPDWLFDAYCAIYAPIIWLYKNGPESIHNAIAWYADFW
jgi:hypothetical protein